MLTVSPAVEDGRVSAVPVASVAVKVNNTGVVVAVAGIGVFVAVITTGVLLGARVGLGRD